MTLTTAELTELISNGESTRLELKARLPRPSEIAREISALANAGGGWLIIGVDESSNSGITVRDVDTDEVELAVRRALMLLHPAPRVRLEFQQFNEKAIALINAEPVLEAPVLTQGIAFTRTGDRTTPASAQQLMQMVGPDKTEAQLLQQLRQFSEAIETQNKIIEQMRAESGWKNKLLWAVIGGVIGMLLSIPTLFFQ